MPLRLAMLGLWHPHAPGMAKQIAAHSAEFELVGVWDPDRSLAEKRRDQWAAVLPNLQVYDSADGLLDQPLDGVVVEGIVAENMAHARRAIGRKLPALVEKPAGANMAEARETFALAQRQGVHLQLAYLF